MRIAERILEVIYQRLEQVIDSLGLLKADSLWKSATG